MSEGRRQRSQTGDLGHGLPADDSVVYVAVYTDAVHRTNIYLSAEEQAALDARAAIEGSSRSVVLRSIVDDALNLAEGDDVIDAALADEAIAIADTARRLSVDDPDLRID